jgi:hypothetical protein
MLTLLLLCLDVAVRAPEHDLDRGRRDTGVGQPAAKRGSRNASCLDDRAENLMSGIELLSASQGSVSPFWPSWR